MKRKFIIIILAFLVRELNAQFMWQIKRDTVVKWYYYDGDEFDGIELDREKWFTSYSYTEVNYPLDFYMDPKRIVFEKGVCNFTCDRDTGLYQVPEWQLDSAFKIQYKASLVDGNKFKYYFSSGLVRSKQLYGKGYFEMRFKHDDSYGMWPAFWLYGKNKDEIDFFELKGERNSDVHVDVHCLYGCDHGYKGGSLFPKSFGGWIKTTTNLKNGYNVIAGEWQDGYVKWYLNGVGIAYFKGEFKTEEMKLIIGTGPGKDGQPFSPGVNKTSYFPNGLMVDYVRIWQRKENGLQGVTGKKQEVFSFYKTDTNDVSRLKKKIGFMYSKKQFETDLFTVSILPASGKKIIVTSLGNTIDYKLNAFTVSGTKILAKNITTNYVEMDFLGLTQETTIRIRIEVGNKIISETIKLR